MEALEEGWGWGWVGDSFSSKDGFSFSFFFESLVFQPVHAHSGPWKETKGCQGQAWLENEGRVIDQTLASCSCKRRNVGGRLSCNRHETQADIGAEWHIYTHTKKGTAHSATHKESLWHLVRVSAGKYLPTGIITEPLAVWPHREPN